MRRKRLIIASAVTLTAILTLVFFAPQFSLLPSKSGLNMTLPNQPGEPPHDLSSGGNSSGPTSTPNWKNYTLLTLLPSFRGVGGEIDGEKNPSLKIKVGTWVNITVINGDGSWHDFVIDELNVHSSLLLIKGEKTMVTFKVEKEGSFHYYCNTRGHREAGMEGVVIVEQ